MTKIDEIEAEYGQPFDQVIRGFAADGCNRAFTAQCLGVTGGWFYHQLDKLKAVGVTFDWPNPYVSRPNEYRPRTPAQMRVFREIVMPRAERGRTQYWAENRIINREKMVYVMELRKAGLTWRKIAKEMGTDLSVLYRERKRQQVSDPIGNRLQKSTQWGQQTKQRL